MKRMKTPLDERTSYCFHGLTLISWVTGTGL